MLHSFFTHSSPILKSCYIILQVSLLCIILLLTIMCLFSNNFNFSDMFTLFCRQFTFVEIYLLFWVKLFGLKHCSCNKIVFLHVCLCLVKVLIHFWKGQVGWVVWAKTCQGVSKDNTWPLPLCFSYAKVSPKQPQTGSLFTFDWKKEI